MSRGRGRKTEQRPFDDGNWIDPDATRCLLIVAIDPATVLEPLLEIDAVAALLVDAGDEAVARQQVLCAHAAGRAALLVDRVDLVRPLAADGVFLSRPSAVGEARRDLDRGELVGTVVGGSRHDAMVAGEDGADYVVFGTPNTPASDGIATLADEIAWWREIAVLPSVAAGRFTAEAVRVLVGAGADFILPATPSDAETLRELAAALTVGGTEQR